MNTLKHTLQIGGALGAVLLLGGCGLLFAAAAVDSRFGTRSAWKSGAHATVATTSVGPTADVADALAADVPDVIALRDATDADAEHLLDELWRQGLDYEVASRSDEHAVLVRIDTGLRVADAANGHYASGTGSWAGARLETPSGVLTVVATEVAVIDVDELLDVLAWAAGETVLASGLASEAPAAAALIAEGFEVALETPEGGMLLVRGAAD